MTDRADTPVETYSRGMLQRLGIADALVKDPTVLILDEPTTAIDPIGVIEILDMLRALVRERGLAVLLSSHLLAQVQSVCDRVGIFAAGQLIGVGTVPELADSFGFSANSIEILIDAPDDQDGTIAEVLRSVPGVANAQVRVVRSVDDTSAEVESVARERGKLKRQQAIESTATRLLMGRGADAALQSIHDREMRNPRLAEHASNPGALTERLWVVTVEPGRALHDMISSIIQALATFRVVRIGRHEPSLDDIYRRAVRDAGLAGRRGAVA
jgi:energy-coupling factor transporter ATP-binding protein EcfA2